MSDGGYDEGAAVCQQLWRVQQSTASCRQLIRQLSLAVALSNCPSLCSKAVAWSLRVADWSASGIATRLVCELTNNTGATLGEHWWRIQFQCAPENSIGATCTSYSLHEPWRHGSRNLFSIPCGLPGYVQTTDAMRVSCWLILRATYNVSDASNARPVLCIPVFSTLVDVLNVPEPRASLSAPMDPLSRQEPQLSVSVGMSRARVLQLLEVAESSCGLQVRLIGETVMVALDDGHQHRDGCATRVHVRCRRWAPLLAVWLAVKRRLSQPAGGQAGRGATVRVSRVVSTRLQFVRQQLLEDTARENSFEQFLQYWTALQHSVCDCLPIA